MDYGILHLGCISASFLVVVLSRSDARSPSRSRRYAARTVPSTGLRIAKPVASRIRPLLARTIKIEFRPVAGCIVSESLVSYVNAYDSVLEEATRREFGRDVFQECAAEAATKWKAQRTAAARKVKVMQ